MGARYAIDAMGWDMLMEEGRKGGRGGQLEDEEAHAAVNLVDEPGPGAKQSKEYRTKDKKGKQRGEGGGTGRRSGYSNRGLWGRGSIRKGEKGGWGS